LRQGWWGDLGCAPRDEGGNRSLIGAILSEAGEWADLRPDMQFGEANPQLRVAD